ncbi:19667_t:CDS:2, partial [Gigaspora rosea]
LIKSLKINFGHESQVILSTGFSITVWDNGYPLPNTETVIESNNKSPPYNKALDAFYKNPYAGTSG